jgi:molecular chaperone DnaK
MKMGVVIGIDLGTTNSCVAYLEAGRPKVIPNLEGQRTTPSVVSLTSSGETLIGSLALRQAVTNPENTVLAIKRLIGKKYDSKEAKETEKKMPYKLAGADNGDVMVVVNSEMISPQEVSSLILGYLKECAEAYLEQDVVEAVITVPANFNDHERKATKDAARICGLKVLRVINEPTSACLAYGLEAKKNAIAAVYDLGGGTFDITLMEISDGVFHVLATNGNSYLGGEDFDNRIMDWIIDEFKRENKVDLSKNKLARQRIKEAAERAKQALSFSMESKIHLPFIFSDKSGPKHIQMVLTRAKLEELTSDLISATFPFMEQTLEDSKLTPQDIDQVILVGGQTRMPKIKEMIADFFGKKPIEDINPEEIVALGAAVQSGIIEGKMDESTLLLDVTPLSLGIETENDTFVKIIERNTTIPTRRSRAFTTVKHNQKRVRVHVLQGEGQKASDNISLAEFNLVGIYPAPAGVPQINVTFEIDADGIVKVSAKDEDSGRVQKIEVKPSSGLSSEEIEKIIQKTQEGEGEEEEEETEQAEEKEEVEETEEEEKEV